MPILFPALAMQVTASLGPLNGYVIRCLNLNHSMLKNEALKAGYEMKTR